MAEKRAFPPWPLLHRLTVVHYGAELQGDDGFTGLVQADGARRCRRQPKGVLVEGWAVTSPLPLGDSVRWSTASA